MHRRQFITAAAGLALCPLCAPAGFAAEGPHWGYTGDTGPDHWSHLDAASQVCGTGAQQSPIDIGETTRAQLPVLDVAWTRHANTIVNNGHAIQIDCGEGSTLGVGKDKYSLQQFHFHRPSEHLIGGKSFPMEAHFVHRNGAGALAVVGVLMVTGRSNPVFHKIVTTMPREPGPPVAADTAIDPARLLPARRSYYTYAGSLTTPPCSEIVTWLLLTNPIQVADADIAAFANLYPMNARPPQKLDRRFVLRSGPGAGAASRSSRSAHF